MTSTDMVENVTFCERTFRPSENSLAYRKGGKIGLVKISGLVLSLSASKSMSH